MFDGIFINQKVKSLLEKAIVNNRVNHCYIFVGPIGTQKRETALRFVKAILCTNLSKPCGRCSSCKKIDNGNHPDFIDIFPQENSLKINQLREMRRLMNIKSYESTKKIFLVNGSETMGIPAQNSLLKSLEEPNEGVIIILISTSSHSLLPTILSRGQIVSFTPFEKDEYTYIINEKYKGHSIPIDDIYTISQGCMGKAIEMMEHPEKIQEFNQFKKYINSIIQGETHKVFEFSKWVKDNHYDNQTVINNLLIIFSTLLKGTFTKDTNDYKKISEYLTYDSFHDIIQRIIDLQASLKYNINFQLQIEELLLKIQEE